MNIYSAIRLPKSRPTHCHLSSHVQEILAHADPAPLSTRSARLPSAPHHIVLLDTRTEAKGSRKGELATNNNGEPRADLVTGMMDCERSELGRVRLSGMCQFNGYNGGRTLLGLFYHILNVLVHMRLHDHTIYT